MSSPSSSELAGPAPTSGGRGRWRRLGLAAVALVVAAVTLPIPGVESRQGETIVVAADEVIEDDLYLFGETVVVEGTVRGDLIAAARHLRLVGTVEGDVLLAAQAIEIEGAILDDARIAGQVLRLGNGAAVGDDLVAAGYSLELVDGARIGGEVLSTGYQAQIDGEVTGGMRLVANGVSLRGGVGGDLDARVGDAVGPSPMMFLPTPPVSTPTVNAGLAVGDAASIGGDLRYEAREEARIAEGAQIAGDVIWTEIAPRPAAPEPTVEPEQEEPRFWSQVRRFGALLVLGLLLVLVAPGWLGARAERLLEAPLPALGWGVVGLFALVVGLGVAAVLGVALLMTLGAVGVWGLGWLGFLLGGVLAGLSLLTLLAGWSWLAPIAVSTACGIWLLRRIRPGARPVAPGLLLGLTLLCLLALLPWVGRLIWVALTLLGFGVLFRWAIGVLQRPLQRGEAAP